MRLLLLLLLTAHAADAWERYSDKDGIASYRAEIPGTKVLAMRGVATVDVPIGRIMGVYLDASRATNWVDLLVQLDERPIAGTDNAVERQIFDMPWPVSDREFVFSRTVVWKPETKTVTISYASIDDPRFPVSDDYVRATDHGSFFRFTARSDGRTDVEVVAKVDPEGSLPAWLFNTVQRSWPRDTIGALVTEASKDDVVPHPTCADW